MTSRISQPAAPRTEAQQTTAKLALIMAAISFSTFATLVAIHQTFFTVDIFA